MNTLFDLERYGNQSREQVHAGTGKHCRHCAMRTRLVYRSGKAFSYCAVKPCGRTILGFKKIKAGDPACEKFEEKQTGRQIEARKLNTIHVNWRGKEHADD